MLKTSMNSLVNYSGSSSDEESDASVISPNKRRCTEIIDDTLGDRPPKVRKADETSENGTCKKPTTSLPMPGAIVGMFGEKNTDSRIKGDKPEEHGGRVRSFPHVEGNWASYVYIPVSPDERLMVFVDQLLTCLQPLNFQRMDNFHVSLSRTVCIRHHWIEPLTQSLKERFQQLDSCILDVGSLKMYTNDEKTRTFLSLEVETDGTHLTDYISSVDSCFKEFNLPPFYQNPSLHISLMWCVGDVISDIPEKTNQKLEVLTGQFLSANTDLSVVPVNSVYLKTGNKMFAFHLSNSDR